MAAKARAVAPALAKPAEKKAGWVSPVSGELFKCKMTLFSLVVLFTLLAAALTLSLIPQGLVYSTLLFFALAWFVIEWIAWKPEPGRIRKAMLVGVFLLAFDFIVENSGWIYGLWETKNSALAIGIVPIEIMLVCLIGGTAWALYLPRKFDWVLSTADIVVFAMFGALGEHMMRQAGLMFYYEWWNFGWALVAYAFTWMILHFVRYRLLRD